VARAFRAYDLNGDGEITLTELQAVNQASSWNAPPDELRRWIRDYDSRGVGSLNLADFERFFLSHTGGGGGRGGA
jgi:Ca2+-binding EF-hand superfamily protein